VDGAGSGSCAVMGFGINGVETIGSATRVLVNLYCKITRNAEFSDTVLLVNRFQSGVSVIELTNNGGSAGHCFCLFG
jgi:hypothetical protein